MSVQPCKNELSILYSTKNIQKDERKENISKTKQIISLHNEKIIDTEKAIKELKEICFFFAKLKDNISCGIIYHHIAKIYEKSNDFEKSKQSYNNALKSFSNVKSIDENIITRCFFEYLFVLMNYNEYLLADELLKKFSNIRKSWSAENQCKYGIFCGRVYEFNRFSNNISSVISSKDFSNFLS